MYNEKIDEIIHLLKNNSISDFIASLSLIVAIIAVIVTIIINVRENKKYINSLKPRTKTKDRQEDINGNILESGYGAEFRLFDKIMIWAWVE